MNTPMIAPTSTINFFFAVRQRALTLRTAPLGHASPSLAFTAGTAIMIFRHLACCVLLQSGFLPLLIAADQIPGAQQTKPIAIVGGTLHTVSGSDIAGGTLVFEAGRITYVGLEGSPPQNAEIIQAEGKHIYPGLIEAHSDLGLVEINAVKATLDASETGLFNPNVQAVVAFNPDSELIPVNRANGILAAVTAPSGGLLAGRSSLMLLDGWTREDMTLRADTGMHLRWPRSERGLSELREYLEQAKRYAEARRNGGEQPLDLRLEALGMLWESGLPLVVEAHEREDIEAAVALSKRQGLKLILVGGSGAADCSALLAREKVPVIVSAVYRTPRHRHSPYDEAYTLPKRLQDAGIAYCISAGGRFGANGIRNLPYNAATAAAYGLSEQQALRAITLSPAEILGVSERMGSLREGLDATLFIADGNILETPTQVERAFIQGRQVDLSNRHTQLYEKYSEKYRRLQPAK
ncbi:MAG: amidohydrolase family protein [Planctomycetales bacterium]|nr:amidohydrolase family protein [Planctomycetales bacterium]